MSDERLALARSNGVLPELSGRVVVLGPTTPARISDVSDADMVMVQSSHRLSTLAINAGMTVQREAPEEAEAAIVVLPRAKAEALHLIGVAAVMVRNGWIVVDGQKTDGIDSVLKLIKKTGVTAQSYSKAHGKTVWFSADQAAALREWQGAAARTVEGWWTAPGVFSADGVDPASALLLEALPALKGTGGDLGAGWGYLSAEVLAKNEGISRLHLVEDNAAALECAAKNISDPRAELHWHDGLSWRAPAPLDWIIMNPPFHDGRSADPDLGRAFIRAAAKLLKPGGTLYMVANAHLPYDAELEAQFRSFEISARTSRFKVYVAEAKRGVTRNR